MLRNPDNDMFYFLSILESTGKIFLYTKGISDHDEFLNKNDQMVYNATLSLLANIGESIAKISDQSQNLLLDIDWNKIKDMRNRIVHDYTGINSLIVYDVVKNDLETLRINIKEIFKKYIDEEIFDIEEYNLSKNSDYYRHVDFESIKYPLI